MHPVMSNFSHANLEADFTRLKGNPKPNARCLISYYPSFWNHNGKDILKFNVKWVGVLDL